MTPLRAHLHAQRTGVRRSSPALCTPRQRAAFAAPTPAPITPAPITAAPFTAAPFTAAPFTTAPLAAALLAAALLATNPSHVQAATEIAQTKETNPYILELLKRTEENREARAKENLEHYTNKVFADYFDVYVVNRDRALTRPPTHRQTGALLLFALAHFVGTLSGIYRPS